MSLQQVENLLEELSERMPAAMVKPLRLEHEVKLLMEMLPTLQRPLSLALIAAQTDPSGSQRNCALSDELAQVFIHCKATTTTLENAFLMCGEIGQKIFRRAQTKYESSAEYQSVLLNSEELFVSVDKLNSDHGDDAEAVAEAFTKDLPEDDGAWLRDHLRDNYGLTSAEDWQQLKEARRCVVKQHPELAGQMGRKAARTLSRKAHQLFETAKANNCTPAAWLQWKETKAQIRAGKVNPAGIINVPGGKQIWGDGEPVRLDSKGKPRRRAIDIFGREVAENEAADVHAINDLVKKAFPA